MAHELAAYWLVGVAVTVTAIAAALWPSLNVVDLARALGSIRALVAFWRARDSREVAQHLRAVDKRAQKTLQRALLDAGRDRARAELAERRLDRIVDEITCGAFDDTRSPEAVRALKRIGAVLKCPAADPAHARSWCASCEGEAT